jgi:hypothetical protein
MVQQGGRGEEKCALSHEMRVIFRAISVENHLFVKNTVSAVSERRIIYVTLRLSAAMHAAK